MRSIIMLLTSLFILQAVYANEPVNKNAKHHRIPHKGYYSIPGKAEKLAQRGYMFDAKGQVNKGYYAAESNKKKLMRAREGYNNKPVVTKGYYSLAKNYKKLNY